MAVRNISVLILYTTEGKVLLNHRSKDAPRLPNYWSLFGGGIEKGESTEQALRREIIEELAYDVRNPHFLIEQKFIHDEDESSKYVFIEQYDGQPLQLGEGQAMEWFYPTETSQLKMSDHDRSVILQVQRYLSGIL